MPRPMKKPAETETRSTVLPPIRVTPAQRRLWNIAAERAGQSLSEWIRSLARIASGGDGD